ncbi:MAG: hypothetical protein MJZ53_00070 [Paludibacteraceae bacterium]|nr:hypothetical protein [Paludibacteraceae bacterium]
MEEFLNNLLQKYQQYVDQIQLPFLFQKVNTRIPFTWNQIKEHQGWENMHTFDEVYNRLKDLQRQMDQHGVGRKTLIKDALDICERNGIDVPKHIEDNLKRYSKRYEKLFNIIHLRNMALSGWTRIDFVLFAERQLYHYLREHGYFN